MSLRANGWRWRVFALCFSSLAAAARPEPEATAVVDWTRPDGAIKVMGKGAKERLVPVGTSSRRAIGRYLAQRGRGEPDEHDPGP